MGTLSLTQPQTCTARYKSLQKKKSPRRLVGNPAQYYGHWLADWASNWHDPAQCSSWRSPAFCKSKGTIASQFSFFPSSLFHIRSDTPQLTCLYHISAGCKKQQPVKSFFLQIFQYSNPIVLFLLLLDRIWQNKNPKWGIFVASTNGRLRGHWWAFGRLRPTDRPNNVLRVVSDPALSCHTHTPDTLNANTTNNCIKYKFCKCSKHKYFFWFAPTSRTMCSESCELTHPFTWMQIPQIQMIKIQITRITAIKMLL